MSSSRSSEDYKIGIICALPLERTAFESVLDEDHDQLPTPPEDRNSYSFGNIGPHNVVVASLGAGDYGTVSARGVADDLRRSFPGVKFGLMVGIAGAMPRPAVKGGDIRLGDIVVGCVNGVPSVINYRLGKDTTSGFDIRSELAEPPEAIQRAVSALKTQHQRAGCTYLKHLDALFKRYPRLNRPQIPGDYYNLPQAPDTLFHASLLHQSGLLDCQRCKEDDDNVVEREPRFLREPPDGTEAAKFIVARSDGFSDYPSVHYGTIASADTLMKNGIQRDEVYKLVKTQRQADILCFEMEAAGIVKGWPCLVIRGICDYSDSHKNDAWQKYAAATAAAYAKDLLLRMAPDTVAIAPCANDAIGDAAGRPMQGASQQNINSGTGIQKNYTQNGGSKNKQYNAKTMTFG